jgi:hypothetical protein
LSPFLPISIISGFPGQAKFSFPFCGTATTMMAAMESGRNSIGIEIDPGYIKLAADRLKEKNRNLFSQRKLVFQETSEEPEKGIYLDTKDIFD